MKTPIIVLDPEIVSRIAAGEVVERPASAVKELVENSIDAGASHISVEVRGGGTNLIKVTDDGSGIPAKEVVLAFERYATSKIRSLEALDSIDSLGFRGEALPSIATVAQVDIVTCAIDEEVGTYVKLADGKVFDHGKKAHSQGTTVTMRNLFRKIPARLKFLKSKATENSHIASVVTQYAFAFPEVRFTLFIDGREALKTPGDGQLLNSIIEIYGIEIAKNTLEIDNTDEVWGSESIISSPVITGRVGLPTIGRSRRGHLSFFVNRRWISSRLLTRAVEDAYHGLLPQGKHPIAVINIWLPPNQVDVNVHPTKTEVKFSNERAIFTSVQRTVRRALIEQMPVPKIEEPTTAYAASSVSPQTLWDSMETSSHNATVTTSPQTMTVSLPILRVLGQLSNSYIVAEGSDGLYLIDQHAAHERVLFEKIRQQKSQQGIEVQRLLKPAIFEVNPQQEEILKSNYQGLGEFGFTIEPFGDRTYLIRAVPALLYNKDWAGMVRELLDSLSADSDWTESVAMSMACHSAVRFGQPLTNLEMQELVRQLEQVAIPNTCPHGRPTIIHISLEQLGKEFKRT